VKKLEGLVARPKRLGHVRGDMVSLHMIISDIKKITGGHEAKSGREKLGEGEKKDQKTTRGNTRENPAKKTPAGHNQPPNSPKWGPGNDPVKTGGEN